MLFYNLLKTKLIDESFIIKYNLNGIIKEYNIQNVIILSTKKYIYFFKIKNNILNEINSFSFYEVDKELIYFI